jgi:RimJ/RimL family protein N-acetyltransferase
MVAGANDLGQPVGSPVPDWSVRAVPFARTLTGEWCRLEPLDPQRHSEDLFRAYNVTDSRGLWTYLPYGPFPSLDSYQQWIEQATARLDRIFFAIVPYAHRRAEGVVALQRFDPQAGSIEVGNVVFGHELQNTTAATEAFALLGRLVFDELCYRRYEWKCDSLNSASRRAATRLGFVYEGTFRNAAVVKGRSRDTDWLSITDDEWPQLRAAYQRWLSPTNFDRDGRQRLALSELTTAASRDAHHLRCASGSLDFR